MLPSVAYPQTFAEDLSPRTGTKRPIADRNARCNSSMVDPDQIRSPNSP